MSLLFNLRKTLGPITRRLGLTGITHRAYRASLRLRYGRDGIGSFTQNGRIWKLHYEVAERGELQEFDTIQWLRDNVRPGDCVLDIGANVGQMTLEAAFLVGPTGKVFAIEPAPGNLKLLRMHIEANGFADRVTVIPAACTATHGGELTLHVVGSSVDAIGSGHTIAERVHPSAEATVALTVKCVSIDGLCNEHNLKPAAIKIDVEGAELEVLRGAVATLKSSRPRMQFGFHPHAFTDVKSTSQIIVDLLRECRYEPLEFDDQGALVLEEYNVYPLEHTRL